MPNYAQLYNKYFNLQEKHILLKTKLSENFIYVQSLSLHIIQLMCIHIWEKALDH